MVINPVYEDQLRAAVLDHPEFGEISVYDLVFARIEQMSMTRARLRTLHRSALRPQGQRRLRGGAGGDHPRTAQLAVGCGERGRPLAGRALSDDPLTP